MSVLRTCSQQGKDAFASLVRLLRFPGVTLLEIVPTANPPPLAKPSRKRCRATTSGRRSGTAKRFRTVAPEATYRSITLHSSLSRAWATYARE
jgi:hypothetical protein